MSQMPVYEKYQILGFPSGLLNAGPKDSQCGVKGSLIMIQGFVVLKRLKLLPKY